MTSDSARQTNYNRPWTSRHFTSDGDASMAREWYYAVDGQQFGPVSRGEIEDMIARGQLKPDDLLWRAGMEDWNPLERVPDFTQVALGPPPLRQSPHAPSGSPDNPFAAPETDIRPEIYAAAGGFAGYAGFWKRVGAAIVDSLVIGVVAFFVGVVLGVVWVLGGNDLDEETLAVMQIVAGVGAVLYFVLMECSERQATIGKSALGIIVTDLGGRRITFGRSLGRTLAKNMFPWLGQFFQLGGAEGLGAVFALAALVSYAMVAFTAKKQGLHDMIAGTLVVNRPTWRPPADELPEPFA